MFKENDRCNIWTLVRWTSREYCPSVCWSFYVNIYKELEGVTVGKVVFLVNC